MPTFDFIIAGGGASGLALAYQMAQSRLHGDSVLIVDRDAKDHNDRTWCFWTDHPTHLDHLVYHTWHRIEFISDYFQQVYELKPYTYKMIRGIDYYKGMQSALAEVPGIEFMQARVTEITDNKEKSLAQVMINEIPYGAKWAFDSLFKPSDYYTGPGQYHYLKQHFKGWEIETPTDCFDPSTATLFDFRTPQKGAMRFMYVLPFTRRRALVEYTLFSADLLKPHEYDRALGEYLESVRHIDRYRTIAVESGVIPMTDRPFPRRLGERILAIGTKGGLVKPSTGFAFLRMQNDAAAVVHSLTNYGNPFQIPGPPWRYRLFDTIMLQVMHRQGGLMKEIFTQLFKNNSIQQIFRFLDEAAPLDENIRLLTTLPAVPFLKALFRVKLLRKV